MRKIFVVIAVLGILAVTCEAQGLVEESWKIEDGRPVKVFRGKSQRQREVVVRPQVVNQTEGLVDKWTEQDARIARENEARTQIEIQRKILEEVQEQNQRLSDLQSQESLNNDPAYRRWYGLDR